MPTAVGKPPNADPVGVDLFDRLGEGDGIPVVLDLRVGIDVLTARSITRPEIPVDVISSSMTDRIVEDASAAEPASPAPPPQRFVNKRGSVVKQYRTGCAPSDDTSRAQVRCR